jgi:hypothetical protein
MSSGKEEVAPCSLPPHFPDHHHRDPVRAVDSSPDDDNEDEDFINDPIGVAVSVHGNNNRHLAIDEDVTFKNNDEEEVATTRRRLQLLLNKNAGRQTFQRMKS